LPKEYQYFIIFQGFSHNLALSEMANTKEVKNGIC